MGATDGRLGVAFDESLDGGVGNGADDGRIAGPLGGPTTAAVPVVGGGAGKPGGLIGHSG